MFNLGLLLLHGLAVLALPTLFNTINIKEADIYQATYSYPISNDTAIFNTRPNNTSHDVFPTQLRGEIYWPVGRAQDHAVPLVLMMSGKHPDCRTMVEVDGFGSYPVDGGAVNSQAMCPPNTTVVQGYRGFDYLGQQLAASGIAAVSADPLLLNNPQSPPENDRYLSAARARLLLKTIEKVRSWDANAKDSVAAIGYDISGKLDFSSIGLMGHSRGGAGVRLAYNMLMTPEKLTTTEVHDWSAHLNATISAVMEVAPLDVLEGNIFTNVVGAPWAQVGAGCESDEVDYAYYRLAQRQSRLNPEPNYSINVYGANHEYFNTEWHQAIDACLGDQENTWNTSASQFNLTSPQEQNFSIPLVLGSQKQQQALSYPLLSFFHTYLSASQESSLMEPFKARANRSALTLRNGVQMGLSNPNVAASSLLQDFSSPNLSSIVKAPNSFSIETMAGHATNHFPVFQSQVGETGLPPFYRTLLGGSDLSGFNFFLAHDAILDDGIVITIPRRIQEAGSIQISLNTSRMHTEAKKPCSIHVDFARRSNCFLPSLAAGDNGNITTAKQCARPREVTFRSRVRALSAGQQNDAVTTTSAVQLKSRFSMEWGPYNVSASLSTEVSIGLLPVAWETVVLDELVDNSSSKDSGNDNIDTADSRETSLAVTPSMVLELTFDAPTSGEDKESERDSSPPVQDFLYVGIVRRVCQ